MRITVDISKVKISLANIKSKIENSKPLLNAIALYHLRQVSVTFQKQGARDEHPVWQPFADQYTRKTDGITIPAWGGVPKIRGKGMVKGRLRPSGKRLTASSKLLQDIGNLRGSFMKQLLENNKVIYGSILSYAGQHQYGDGRTPKREMLFFTENDKQVIQGIVDNYVKNDVLAIK